MDEKPDQLDVIAVGAHPDDVEIGCGGTLARLVEQGYRVGIIDLTDGEPTPGSPGPDHRLAEAHEAARILGVHKRVILELPNRRLFDTFEARVQLACEFRRFRPRIVLSLGCKTPLASPDHFQAAQITDAAVFYSRLTKWDDHFDGLPVHSVHRQAYYSLFYETDWSGSAGRQFVVDISTTLDRKLAAARCYQSQFPPEKGYLFERVEGMARALGGAAGYSAGEVFTSTRTLGTRDLVQFLQDDALFPPSPEPCDAQPTRTV